MADTYREAPRGYASVLVVVGIFAVGYGIDAAFGGARAHLWGWLIGFAVVVAIYVLIVYAARSQRTLLLTSEKLSVGDESVPRAMIVGVQAEVDESLTVLGMPLTDELPKGVRGVAVLLSDGTAIAVPTRFPEKLTAALGFRDTRAEVRAANEDDLQLLDEIGDRADAIFRVAGMQLPEMPISQADLDEAKAIFVVGRPPFAFVLVSEADGNAHIDELAVIPAKMRQGIGSRLVEHACQWAADSGYAVVTLTTYSELPWNRPFYERLGFALTDEIGAEVADRREYERTIGLDALGERIVMRRNL